ncbi:hypothetical protein KR093_007644 [Drosophila rubida]|uniref:MADF domain-containing protein n=1 Tax=Drosophila rubida TaxID=30044 RepID=A0AAD4JRA9_9MUSC|nr:hypothetical protein KR093_007644 [Drosophila rubida]
MSSEGAASDVPMVRISFRFTDERHLKFVEAFSREPCLWNRHPYLWGARVAACKRIQDVMNGTLQPNENPISLQGIKMKIKNMRSVYHQELKKIKANPYYYPRSCWFEPLDKILGPFLDRNDDDEQLISPIALKRLQVKVPRLKSIRLMPNSADERTEVKIELEDELPTDVPSTLTAAPPLRMITPPPRPATPSPNPPQIVEVTSLHTTKPTILEQTRSLQSAGEDEFTFFGLSVAAQLRSMPLSSAMVMQSKIQYMISKERRRINGDTSEANLFF